MFTSEFVVKNPTGLHARPASQLAKLCKDIPDDIRLICEEGASEQESGAKIMEFLEGLTD